MITKLIDKIHDLEERRDNYSDYEDDSILTEEIMQSTIDILKEFLVEQFRINLDDPHEMDETWLRMATAREDNHPVLCEIAYQHGHSIASDGFRMHVLKAKSENAKDVEQLAQDGLKYPDVNPIWQLEDATIIRLRPEFFIDALVGLVDDDYNGILMAVGKAGQPVLLWNPRTQRKACFMPMKPEEEITIPTLEKRE